MSFDYFNTSYLAFGSKLTKAFRSLASSLDNVNKNVEVLQDQLSYYSQYIGRNYKVPEPSLQTSPVRAKEVYNLLSNITCYVKDISIGDNGLRVKINLFNKNSNKISYLFGEDTTSIENGVCCADLSSSNDTPSQEIRFYNLDTDEEESWKKDNGTFLFRYVICPNTRKVILHNVNPIINLVPKNVDGHYYDFEFIDATNMLNLDSTTLESGILIAVSERMLNQGSNIKIVDKLANTIPIFSIQATGAGDKAFNRFSGGGYLIKGDKIIGSGIDKVYTLNYLSGRRVYD